LVAELESSTIPASIPPTSAASTTSSVAQVANKTTGSALLSEAPGATKATAARGEEGPQLKTAAMSTATVSSLTSDDAAGTVSISSDPSGADIFVDSVGQGHTPAILKLKPGKHHIQLVAAGYKDSVNEIDLKAGASVTVAGKLEK
jgi:hypothetical protein